MLIPNLSVLLAERRLTLSKVSEDTRISRTTLTALSGRGAKGIQFETLNTLCQYLKVTPNELFLYRPFDLVLSADPAPGRTTVALTVTRAGGVSDRYLLNCDADFRHSPENPAALEALSLRLSLPAFDDPADTGRNAAVEPLLRSLPAPALQDLEFELLRAFDRIVPPSLAPDDYTPSLRWPWQ